MSDLIDQRGKGQPNQVSNGPGRDKEEKFDAYLQQPQTSYGPGTMSSPGVAENSFLPNYYTAPFPYAVGQGMNDGAWSNGGEQPMFSMNTYDYNGIFNSFGFPPYGWDYTGANDYWGSVGQGRKDARPYAETDAYYQPEMMTGDPYMMNGDLDHDITGVDQGLKGMSLGNDKNMVENGPSDMGMDNGNVTGSVAPQMQQTMSSAPKKTSWAAIASQPARPQPMKRLIPRAPANPNKPHNMDIGTWDNSRGGSNMGGAKQPPPQRTTWTAPRRQMTSSNSYNSNAGGAAGNHNQSNSNGTSGYNNSTPAAPPQKNPVLDKLRSANMYNPKEFNLNPKGARYFIIKSYSEDDIHRSIKYSIWCSTEHGNKRLDSAYREREGKGPLYLFFSVNSSGHFCGMAQMMSAVDYNSTSGVWCQDKWKGVFEVKWIYVKDIPNGSLRHIRLENNENKPVTNSRDTQEVPPEKGKQVLKILHNYHHTTSIFDDFVHYEKRQEEDSTKDPAPSGPNGPSPSSASSSRPQGQGQGGQGQGQGNSQKDRPERRPRQN